MFFGSIVASDIVRSSLTTLWGNVAGFAPRLVAALVVFLVGWLIAVLIAKLVWHVVRVLQVDRGLESLGFKKVWERSGYKLNTPKLFYELVKWFFIIVFLMASTNILGLGEVSEFLRTVVFYLPNVFVAAFVMLIGVLVARFLEGLVKGSVKAAQLASAHVLSSLAKWSVLIFSVLIALDQLKVAPEIIRIIVVGLVSAGSLAIGLAFGLGGKEHASRWIEDMKKKISE
ncbi:MAG: hypothetical protein Q8Q06_04590 [bacterium]|nr:hypothetical protein [bacterium]